MKTIRHCVQRLAPVGLRLCLVGGTLGDALLEIVQHRLADLLALVGWDGRPVRVDSLEHGGAYRSSILEPGPARDPLTLLALRLNGDVLHPDHGYPLRLIAPNRPGVLQTKWVGAVTVVSS